VIDVRPIDSDRYEYFLPARPLAEACVCDELGTSGADIPSQVFPPGKSPTSSIHPRGNLDQTAVATAPFDPANAEATSSFATTVTVNDLLGNAVALRLYFSKLDAKSTKAGDSGDWTYHVLAGGDAAPRTVVAAGLLRFDEYGQLISNDTTINATGDFGLEAIRFEFGNGTASGGSGFDGLTQYAASSAISDTKLTPAYPESCRLSGVDTTGFLCWRAAWPE
jgi:flagellar hook protein FlgE